MEEDRIQELKQNIAKEAVALLQRSECNGLPKFKKGITILGVTGSIPQEATDNCLTQIARAEVGQGEKVDGWSATDLFWLMMDLSQAMINMEAPEDRMATHELVDALIGVKEFDEWINKSTTL